MSDNLQNDIINALQEIYDPEIPVNIYDLGLIYDVDVNTEGEVKIEMTLTTPGCPVAQTFPQMVQDKILEVKGIKAAHVELVWEPPWTQDNMSDAAKLQLGLL